MCYSAQVWADYRKYLRMGASVDFQSFHDLLMRRQAGERIFLPKGMTDAFKFGTPDSVQEEECKDLVLAYESQQVPLLYEDLDKQMQRQASAEASLARKETKTASEERRKASKNVRDLQRKLEDLDRREHLTRDDRIFVGHYCPVLTRDEDGDLIVTAMRFQCRLAGKPAFYDSKFPGTYNARRDNLTGFWRAQYGKTHAVVMATAFFEHVKGPLVGGEGEQDLVLRFYPREGELLPLACLWSHWVGSGDEKDLLSFALITDEPPQEVRAAGHDRCPIPLATDRINDWLLDGAPTAEYEAMLDGKARPYFEHEAAA